MQGVTIQHFSDVLCIWAYVSQIRVDELQRNLGNRVELSYHFVPIFGNIEGRIGEGWKDRGGFPGYADHVQAVCEEFPHVELHPDAWRETTPASSAVAHQFIKALEGLEAGAGPDGRTAFEEAVWQIRLAFFGEGRDVARTSVLLGIAEKLGFPIGKIEERMADGRAMAAICRDNELGTKLKIEGSPTYVLNQGRQKLYGNVGYRILEANVEELLHRPAGQASWC